MVPGTGSGAVALTGAGDALGRRVAAGLDAAGVRRLDEPELLEAAANGELKRHFEGAETVIHLAGGLDETRAVLDAAGGTGVQHVVILSSATVYGAWPENPVPLTEDAPIRPNPGFDFAIRAAERERLAAEWKLDHPGATVTVLRPVTPLAEGVRGWLAERLIAATSVAATTEADCPMQFVHLDDVAAAVVLAADQKLDGVFNVAPVGWIPGDRVRALIGSPRLRVPARAADWLRRARWRLGIGAPPDMAPYATNAWVVASDRLRAKGWVASHTNEEAFVAGTPAKPWASVTPQRRQELALGVAGAVVAGAVAGAVVLSRRASRRARSLRS